MSVLPWELSTCGWKSVGTQIFCFGFSEHISIKAAIKFLAFNLYIMNGPGANCAANLPDLGGYLQDIYLLAEKIAVWRIGCSRYGLWRYAK